MQFARRAFLRALPGAVAAAPIVAKAAADELIAQDAGLGMFNPLGIISGGAGDIPAMEPAGSSSEKRRLRKDFFRKFALPDWERDQMWEDTCVAGLDPDIAAKKSWSMSVKILTQRQRNFAKRLARQDNRWTYEDLREAFHQKFGFWL